jgi:hypothetical protein
MTEHKNIDEAMLAAQMEFGTVVKGSINPAFKSKYAGLPEVVAVVAPTLNRNGVTFRHYLFGEQLEIVRTEFKHAASGTRIWCDVPMITDKNNMQGKKSASTYAKRIGLESLSGIAPEDDDGNAAVRQPGRPANEQAAPSRPIAADELAVLRAALEVSGRDIAKFCAHYKIDALPDLPSDKFRAALDAINTATANAKRAA